MPSSKFKPVWRKNVGVGPLLFNAPISDYLDILRERPDQPLVKYGELSYDVPSYGDHLYVYAEDGKIVTVSCYAEFLAGERNVLGMTMEMVVDVLGQHPDEVEKEMVIDDEQDILYFYSSGLMIWLNDGVVVTVQALASFPEDWPIDPRREITRRARSRRRRSP